MEKYIVLMRPRFVPLWIEFRTLEQAKNAVAWQERGTAQAKDFAICEVKDGKLYEVATGEEREPHQGFYTDKAWSEFLSRLAGV